jgi:cell division protein FtsB
MKDFFSLKNTSRWWKERFITLMVIPERTRRVHKFIIPFFIIKFGVGFIFFMAVFLFIFSIDYLHVLGRVSENKKLKGENFKLRQELQQIKNKVESMESTVDRVRNYAKKLQILTGQPNEKTAWSGPGELNIEPEFNEGRSPALCLRSALEPQ